MSEQNHRYRFFLISICLVAAIIAVYWPVYKYDFVAFDDDIYVTNNANIQSGFNLQNIKWAFTAQYAGNWHPLTWLSHTLDYQLFKNWAGGYHLINVLFHILNTLLLFYLLKQVTAALWPSAFIAAAFALHPLHIESVAWIAERKDLLSTFFLLLTIWAYISYVRRLNLKYYLAAVIFFIFGLMSKPMLVTLPFILLLLDYWPIERKFSKILLIEKIPFFILSLASSVITYFVQRKASLSPVFESIAMGARFKNAIAAYVEYIIKMFWPAKLAVIYPHPGGNLSIIKVIICALLLILITVLFIYMAKRHRFLIAGWLWYLGMLVPVIGLVQVGNQGMADRYTYITLTGLFIIIAWSAKEFIPRNRYKVLILSAAVVLIVLAVTASRQLKHWKNSQTLFKHAIEITENNYMMLDNYGILLARQSRLNEAVECFKESLKIRPDSAVAYNNLGGALLQSGKIQPAINCFKGAIKYYPGYLQAYSNLGDGLKMQGEPKQAAYYFNKALEIAPNHIRVRFKLGLTLMELQEFEAAVESFNKVIELEPDNVAAYGYRGLAFAALGKNDEAIISYRAALNLDPNNPDLCQLLKEALKNQEKGK